MIRGVHHTSISTGDFESALRFYPDLLGFEEMHSITWDVGSEVVDKIVGLKDSSARLVCLKAGDAFIEPFQYQTTEPEPGEPKRPVCNHGITHICLGVLDVDAVYERLRAAEIVFHCPPQNVEDGTIRTTYGRDPDGNVIDL